MAVDWGAVGAPVAPVEDDDATASLLSIIPEHKREVGEPLIRGWLGNVKAQLSAEDYATYCATLKRAYDAHVNGDIDTARAIFAQFGIPYDMLAGEM